MITLYGFGPAFGLPDPSPFVTKVETFLKMANLPYRIDTKGFTKHPRESFPISTTMGRSSLIRPSSAGTSKTNTASISIAA